MSGGVERWRELLRPIFADRKWLVVGGPKAGLLGAGRELLELGARRPFLLADRVGTGELPSPEEFAGFTLGLRGGNMVESHRLYERLLGDPPPEARAAVERWDPGGEALAVGKLLLEAVPQVAGRRRFGVRRRAWIELEDKVVIDGFWDAWGIERPPSRIVPVEDDALSAAAAELDRGLGSAWAGDAREGAHGGGVYLRWVRDGEQAARALEFFSGSCDRVRVTPFLEGIPCSVSGIVFERGTAIFRPVEMCILRRPGRSELFYGGFATFWDPEPADREHMRDVARRAAQGLRSRYDYRGAFTVDGVMSADGFLPTELNPRIGATLGLLERSSGGLPLALLSLAAIEGCGLDFDVEELEREVLEAADADRAGRVMALLEHEVAETRSHDLVREEGGWRLARDGEQPQGAIEIGPGVSGGVAFFRPEPDALPKGRPLAPEAVEVLALGDRELGLGVGQVESAQHVR